MTEQNTNKIVHKIREGCWDWISRILRKDRDDNDNNGSRLAVKRARKATWRRIVEKDMKNEGWNR